MVSFHRDGRGEFTDASQQRVGDLSRKPERPHVGSYDLSVPLLKTGVSSQPRPAYINRPLYRYVQAPEAFHCPADNGQEFPINDDFGEGPWKPSNYESRGCSYRFNCAVWENNTRKTPADPVNNLGGKKESWVPEPSRFIMMHEPPAMAYLDQFYHWHYARGRTTVTRGQLKNDNQKFVSAIGFVDGHAAQHDFTKALTASDGYPIEPTPQWIWYKPKE